MENVAGWRQSVEGRTNMTRKSNGDSKGQSSISAERVFRVGILVVVILGLIALICLGIYAVNNLLGGRSGTETATPPPEVTEETSGAIQATMTAECASFIEESGGTPCPSEAGVDLAATATAACADFISEFPGTPCP
jgi:hypothetical protein